MAEINDRLKILFETLKESGVKQNDIAKKLNISHTVISRYKSRLMPSKQTITNLCRCYHVNETWIRTGEGKMFATVARQDDLNEFIGEILSEENDFRRRFISALARMTPQEWELLERKIKEISGENTE